jgi:signal transduction histidine kinase
LAEPGTALERGPDRLASLCRIILVFRLASLLLTLAYFIFHRPHSVPLLLTALALALPASYIPLRHWDRVGPVIMRHPALLGVDLLLAQVILLLTGVEGPFFLYTLSSALLGGVIYGWRGAVAFSTLLLAGYYGVVALHESLGLQTVTFQSVAGQPALYLFAAAGGAAVRRRLETEAAAEASLANERVRLRVAREMHDSLGKTLHGMALSAAAVARLVPEDPERAAARANELADGARAAADEARELIRDLRADRLAQPLHEAVRAFVQEWSETAGVDAEVEVEPVPVRSPEARYEVFSVLREALENVRRHAAAETVTVALRRDGDGAALTVCDDGCGASRGVLERASRDGHFGLVGMHERAERLGGRLEIAGVPGKGTTIRALLPPDPQILDPIGVPERELV